MNSKRKDANTQCSGFAKQNSETHVLTRVFHGAVQKSTIFELLDPFFSYDKYYGHQLYYLTHITKIN